MAIFQTQLYETHLSESLSDQSSINSLQGAICPGPSLLSYQTNAVQQIVSHDAVGVVGDEKEGGSDKSVALNCYRFGCLNLFLWEVKSLGGAGAEVQRKELSHCLNSKWWPPHPVIPLQVSS